MDKETDEQKRKQMLEAALHCFLEYGYSKTSMDDVAKKAGISRAAIYLKFKNKLDLLRGAYVDTQNEALQKAAAILEEDLDSKEALVALCLATKVEPWTKVAGRPRAAEFYSLCAELLAAEAQKLANQQLKAFATVLKDKETAEIFLMALDGFYADLPSTTVLRKRVLFLIDRFV